MSNDALIEDLAALSRDPLRFVLWAFPWSEPNTVLTNRGIEPWQREVLTSVRDKMAAGVAAPEAVEIAIREATVSGNGVGKSGLVSWLILWLFSTFEDTKGVVTANTETQLKTKTWAELGKWFNLFIARDLFRMTATGVFSKDPNRERTWRVDAIPWSDHNVVAFQGLHNEGKRLFIIFDEASGISDPIWEAADGCMTDKGTQRFWFVFGNPNNPTGRFRDCFPGGKFAAWWTSRAVDSRTVSFVDKAEIAKWIEHYGEDDDFVRVRVRGIFPRVGTIQFIPADLAAEAMTREAIAHLSDPFVLGVDVARFGDNATVLWPRRGRDARTIERKKIRGANTMAVAAAVADFHAQHKFDAIFVDGTGVGGGVVDRLRQLRVPVIDVNFSSKPDRLGLEGDLARYANKRAEMWGSMKEWLRQGAIPPDPDLQEQLGAPEYSFNVRGEIQLEAKEDMRRRGKASPDDADALALTFAYPVMPRADREGRGRSVHKFDYEPLAEAYQLAS